MATIHITDPQQFGNLSALLDRVRQGDEIVFKEGDRAVAVMHAPSPPRRTIDECIALMPANSPPVDEDFVHDLDVVTSRHREALDSSKWD